MRRSKKDKGGVSWPTLNLQLFERMDRAIDERMLFIDQNLSREQLCAMIGVDRNRFAAIIKEHAGCRNMSDYINRKRINYAVKLMRENPQWSIEAVCHACGMSDTSFKRWFKTIYGMPPSAYWESL